MMLSVIDTFCLSCPFVMSFVSIQSCMSLKRSENYVRGFGDFSMSVCMVPLLVDGMELKAPDYSSSLKTTLRRS